MLWKKKSPTEDPTSLCNVLLKLGWISEGDVEEALQEQRRSPLIGRVLVEMKRISEEQLEEALEQQKIARGQITQKQAVVATFERQKRLHEKVLIGLGELKAMAQTATATARLASKK